MILAVVSVLVSCQTKDPLAVTDAEYAVVTAPDNEFRILNVFDRSKCHVIEPSFLSSISTMFIFSITRKAKESDGHISVFS